MDFKEVWLEQLRDLRLVSAVDIFLRASFSAHDLPGLATVRLLTSSFVEVDRYGSGISESLLLQSPH